jgi:phosphoribosylformylglycinamidine synthase
MNFKSAGNYIYLVGLTKNELGGSIYAKIKGLKGIVPDVDIKVSKKLMKAMYDAISSGFVEACHDCSEGGFAAAVSEMAFAGELGAKINADLIKNRFSNDIDGKTFLRIQYKIYC